MKIIAIPLVKLFYIKSATLWPKNFVVKKIFDAQKWCIETKFGLKCTHFGALYLKDGERFWQMPVTIFLNRSKKDVEIIFLAKWIFKHFLLKKWS